MPGSRSQLTGQRFIRFVAGAAGRVSPGLVADHGGTDRAAGAGGFGSCHRLFRRSLGRRSVLTAVTRR